VSAQREQNDSSCALCEIIAPIGAHGGRAARGPSEEIE
jgi:hypothetical protein